ncbi:hypothetical protein K492DRAFT_174000 [Lichtheimia hyalospora FSU 10163]|nr:hypothetical protein K492DRAFT_174000 [Lichtheimia hyalospora FSU 10163]
MKQQQHKVQGMEIELVQARNAVEQPGKAIEHADPWYMGPRLTGEGFMYLDHL